MDELRAVGLDGDYPSADSPNNLFENRSLLALSPGETAIRGRLLLFGNRLGGYRGGFLRRGGLRRNGFLFGLLLRGLRGFVAHIMLVYFFDLTHLRHV